MPRRIAKSPEMEIPKWLLQPQEPIEWPAGYMEFSELSHEDQMAFIAKQLAED